MMDPNPRLIAGAMSGTSADGVDVAITRVTGRGLDMTAELVRHHHRPYDPSLRQAIFSLRNTGHTELRELARIGREVSLTYAAAVTEALTAADLKAPDLTAIAAHGQTLFHDAPLTIQYLDPSLLAYETGCPVVSDFRRADLAAGGQGAPLVPFADYILFRHPTKSRVLLNIGGIANITYLPAGCTPDKVVAFDTGPGNCISDHICRLYDPAGPGYDEGGLRARRGRASGPMKDYVLALDYFRRPPPKSTDGPAMIAAFESTPVALWPHFGRADISDPGAVDDLLATAALITGCSIQEAIYSLHGHGPIEVLVSGGGVENAGIMHCLAFEFIEAKIYRTDTLGVSSAAKEALAFALLGAATLDGVPSNVPSVTGARRGVVLGSITPRP